MSRFAQICCDVKTAEGKILVDFGDGEEPVDVATNDCVKIKDWNHLEVGDNVKVKDADIPAILCIGKITAFSLANGAVTYTITYDNSHNEEGEEAEEEEGVTEDRIFKVSSGRHSAQARWKMLKNAVKIASMLKMTA